ncbi:MULTISPECIES: DUF354 domain-containing protein [Sanguibacteroides]|uniref:DUF354 domain-containing protein n=1 Tax=Sanguibacteroides justesenii TaxID=1547597 RepID=A0AB34R8Z1_9PORP|nr:MULTISPECIES: DUF354 domain-containing protein [Sanguibacteroides]KIO46307.1 hypothetical protein IE90_05810 [Sanguibacteroides justesenii]PXZ44368.1 DUF354 domain-containing protein [Sanguibacteroides justesenii]
MRILIDIGHPAHVHLFSPFASEMKLKGHEILFTCREKEHEKTLLQAYGNNYVCLGKHYSTKIGKVWGLLRFDMQLLLVAWRFKPDLFLSAGSFYAAHVAYLMCKPHLSFEDTFNYEQVRLYEPFTKVIFTSDYRHPCVSKKEIHYSGYHELAYLHPKRFTPNGSILEELGVVGNEKYVIVRLVSWKATHDVGHKGIFYENKLKAIEEFSKFAKVFISSEAELPEELRKYQIKIEPHRMHDALAFASLIFGESSTMSEEAVMLGTPAVYLLTKSTFYTRHLEEDYGLMFNYSESEEDQIKAIAKGVELLQMKNVKERWKEKRDKMLADKIDVTAFLVWFVENWPDSFKIMKKDPDYQNRFK